MAVAVFGGIPGGNAEIDQQLIQELGITPDSPPSGSLLRFAGQAGDLYRIISVWESRAAWDEFVREKLGPVFEKRGGSLPPFEVMELDTLMVRK